MSACASAQEDVGILPVISQPITVALTGATESDGLREISVSPRQGGSAPGGASLAMVEERLDPVTEKSPHANWRVLQGETLQSGLRQWANTMDYELVWDAPYDFPIRASLSFSGDFVSAVTQMFDAYRTAGRPLQVDVYREQRLVRVYPQDEVAYE